MRHDRPGCDDVPELRRAAERDVAVPPGVSEAVWSRLVARFGALDDLPVGPAAAVSTVSPPAAGTSDHRPAARTPDHRIAPFRTPTRRPRLAWAPVVVAAAVALVFGATALLGGPAAPTAFAAVTEARRNFAELPALHVVVVRTVGLAQLRDDYPSASEDWVQVWDLQWQDGTHFREVLIEQSGAPPGAGPSPDSFTVADGDLAAAYDATRRRMTVAPAGESAFVPAAIPMIDPALQGGPALDDGSIKRDCRVTDEGVVAGQPVRQLTCAVAAIPKEGLPPGGRATVSLDRRTGAVLHLGFPNGSRVDVRSVDYRPSFAAGTFSVEAPEGAEVLWVGRAAPPARYRGAGSSSVVASVPLDAAYPNDIAVGEGAVWVSAFIELNDDGTPARQGRVFRIDPARGEVVATIVPSLKRLTEEQRRRVGDRVVDVPMTAAGSIALAGGWVWVADPLAGTVERIDPATNRLAGDPVRVGEDPFLASDGEALWILTGEVSSLRTVGGVDVGIAPARLLRLDPVTGAVLATIPISDLSWGWGRVVVAGGAVWAPVAEIDPKDPRSFTPPRFVVRVDPATSSVTARIRVDGGLLAAGVDALWTGSSAEEGEPGTVGRIDPSTNRVTASVPVPGGVEDLEMAAGVVWAANYFAGTVTRIDPATTTVTGTIRVGGGPNHIAGEGAMLWVVLAADHRVVRVVP